MFINKKNNNGDKRIAINDNSTIDFDNDDDNHIVHSHSNCFKSIRSFLIKLFPIFGWLPYCFPTILNDILAGIYIGLYQIPQCIAYSIIAEYPLSHTIHTNVIASILYALIGGNRRFSYGIFSLVSAIYIGIILERIKDIDDTAENVIIVVTFSIGICCLLAGLLRIGSMVRFIPYEILSGFRAGLYLLLITLQICSMAGYYSKDCTLGNGKSLMIMPDLYRNKFYTNLTTKHINWNSWIVSIGCIALLTLFRLFHYYWNNIFNYRLNWLRQIVRRIPIEFILIAIGIIVANFVDVKKYKIYTIDGINFGNESLIDMSNHLQLKWPPIQHYLYHIWFELITATLLFLIYMHSLALDFLIQDTEEIYQPKFTKRKHRLNPKQMKFYRLGWKTYNMNNELLYKGFIDLIGSFIKCLPSGPSKIRSDRMRNVGACTQISSLIASAVILAIWLTTEKYFAKIPKCIVASIVTFDTFVALIKEFINVKNFWKTSIFDIIIWILTFISFIMLTIEQSLYFSLGLSLIVYCLRYQNFESFRFSLQKALITTTNMVVLVPRDFLYSKFNDLHHHHHHHDEDHNADDNECNILKTIPSSTLKTINIFRIDQRIMTIANIDSFVRDVCRKVSDSMIIESNMNMRKRLIFDCRSISYLDWPSIRAVKGTIMRIIQVSESWQQSAMATTTTKSSSSFNVINDSTIENDRKQLKKEQYSLVAMFIFRTQLVQIIHNAGEFSIHFYHSLHQSLHIGLKAAINMAITIPTITNSDRYDTLETIKHLRINSLTDEEKIPTTIITNNNNNNNQSTASNNNKKQNRKEESKEKKLKNLFNKRVVELEMQSVNENVSKINNDDRSKQQFDNNNKNNNNDNSTVLPISFRQQNSIDQSEQSSSSSSSSIPPRFQIINQQSLEKNYELKDDDNSQSKQTPKANESIVHNKLSKSIIPSLAPPPPPPPPPEPKFTYIQPGNWKKPNKETNQQSNNDEINNQPIEEESTSSLSMSDFKKHLENLFK
uniref:Uncharacterized protein LOC113798779 n=1 Tax=Dermatophagoides pteronyssinus TaxID=6956 RepID=A0A6P6YK84_DERPT|nr:uncharacterized protein LOC113798779 [Dermatophagoides pteronyssinus]